MTEEHLGSELMVERRDQTCVITINRPDAKNALTPSMLRSLPLVLDAAAADPQLRVVVVTGAGDAFSSGYDLREVTDDAGKAQADEVLRTAADALGACDLPVIARIDGWCIGAGLEVALSCDVRLSSSRSTFFLPATGLGIIYPDHGLQRIYDAVGLSEALRIALFGERLSADEALRIGLVSAVADDLDALVSAWEERICKGAASSVVGMKRVLRRVARGAGGR